MKKSSGSNKAATLAAQWHAQALIRHKAGQLDAADPLYRQALKQAPDFVDSLHMLGVLHAQRGQPDEAAELIGRALQRQPGEPTALNNLGGVLNQLQRHDEALACFGQLCAQQPANAEAHTSRADALRGLGRFEESLAACDKALQIHPGLRRAQIARANALRRLSRFDEALAVLDAVLAEHANSPEALNDRGNVLFDLRRFEEALASFEQALQLRPAYAEALFNRANTLRALYRFDAAVAAYDALLHASPSHAEGWNNRGAALEMRGDYAQALTSYASARAANPQHVMAHLNAALCHLLLGEFEQGWPLYRWREHAEDARLNDRPLPAPRWDGATALAGKRILLLSEQGLGDTLQFCRYARLLAAQGADVLLETWPALESLLGRVAGVSQIVRRGEAPPAVDFCVPLLDLPGLLGTGLDTIPADTPYLHARADRLAHWRDVLAARCAPGKKRIGLVWSGNPRHSNDHKRSIALARLRPLLEGDAQFISLQPEVRESDLPALANSPALLELRDEIRDFEDTAALIEQLDLIISVDTSVAHLAGALGRPTWLLLPAKPDWRWLLERTDSPWYPGMRLFRQPCHDDWDSVIAALAATPV
ncbi:tetratricopeptide repeat protein [Uliginosibacterium sp. 31-16]|uniref:tetratricopeptide repeat protein n=1 Tax=Uliginosibacterium sp. 31-16 TaxID=3068315 RepID=UPI00273DB446|nr:tetratricopeptide repeat protein [Uliginosibacterium sp. 31-16]MDP5240537.1 tetratricopeptide repeat protein [Uliginosibacterium sp. 31-16]